MCLFGSFGCSVIHICSFLIAVLSWMIYLLLRVRHWKARLLLYCCLLLPLVLPGFALYMYVLWCWALKYLQLLYLLDRLNTLLLHNEFLYPCLPLLVSSLFCLIERITSYPCLFWSPFVWSIFSCSLTTTSMCGFKSEVYLLQAAYYWVLFFKLIQPFCMFWLQNLIHVC